MGWRGMWVRNKPRESQGRTGKKCPQVLHMQPQGVGENRRLCVCVLSRTGLVAILSKWNLASWILSFAQRQGTYCFQLLSSMSWIQCVSWMAHEVAMESDVEISRSRPSFIPRQDAQLCLIHLNRVIPQKKMALTRTQARGPWTPDAAYSAS